MKNQFVVYFTLAVIGSSAPVHADLIGDTVNFNYQTIGSFSANPTSAVVGGGVESTIAAPGPFAIINIDLDANSITLTSTINNLFQPNDMLTISDLDWIGTPGEITGFVLTNNGVTDLVSSDITTMSDSVEVFTGGSHWDPGDNIVIDLQVTHIPEPPAFLFLGLVGLIVGSVQRFRRR